MSRTLASWLPIPAAALLAAFLLCSAQAQTPAPTPPPKTAPVIIPPGPAAPSPPAPANTPKISSTSDQFAQALNNQSFAEAIKLLQADPTLATTVLSDGTPPLVRVIHNYILYNDSSKRLVQLLLDNGADVNKPDHFKLTPFLALLSDDVKFGRAPEDVALLLINQGADIEAVDPQGKTALHLAAEAGDNYIIKLLLSHNADVNARTRLGDTPLNLAISRGNSAVTDLLLAAGANVNLPNIFGDMPIHLAMRWRHYAMRLDPSQSLHVFSGYRNPLLMPHLLAHGARINAPDQFGMSPLLSALLSRDKLNQSVLIQHHAAKDMLTAVFNAAATNDTVTLARLLKTLPDFKDLRAPNGMTALHVAAIWNAPDTTRLLIHAGMDINGRDETAETPLHAACRFPQDSAMVRLLLDAGANPNARNLDGETPVHLAVHANSLELTRLLLTNKAAPDLPDASGRTPLDSVFDNDNGTHDNINSDSISIVKLLLNAGADPNTPFLNGYDLLSQAFSTRNIALVALLVSRGADVNYINKADGESSLMKAVYWGNKDIISLLLDKGADINYKTRYGASALDRARDNSAISDLLKQRGAKD